ncbi:hypothetical protein GCM10010170_012830 [Dactylosporangium salmoneum]|uniref:Uncharacterized protein n=1 Tax=Dactylosporangium salmoneum TaxID=53361 RepID=A0ABP5SKV0_9ACTN
MADELVLSPARGRLVLWALLPLLAAAVVAGYALALDATGTGLVVILVLAALAAAVPLAVRLVALAGQLGGPAPRLDRVGVHLRTRPWRRRLVTLPWEEIPLAWLGGGGRWLGLSPDPRGPHADDWDPAGTRWTRRFRPLMVPVPPSVPADRVRAAVAALSGGTVELADRGPDAPSLDEDPAGALRAYRARRPGPRLRLAATLAVLVFAVPLAAGTAAPWNQPWWPGAAVAGRAPDACAVFAGDFGALLGVTGHERTEAGPRYQACTYTVPQGTLTVTARAEHTVFGSSTADAAGRARELAGALGGAAHKVDGIGDAAWLAGNPQGTTTLIDRAVVAVVARRANVVLVIAYGGETEPDAAQDAVTGAARATLAALDLG